MESKEKAAATPAKAGIFATLFAEETSNRWEIQQGRYDAARQLYVNEAGDTPFVWADASTEPVHVSYCKSGSECWTGEGNMKVVDDSSTDWQACD